MISEKDDFPFVLWRIQCNENSFGGYLTFTELDEIRVGIKSAKPRKIGREGGVMGVIFREGNRSRNKGNEVVPQAAAYKAGLQSGDIICKVDKRTVKKRDQVVKLVSKKDPGDLVVVDVLRNDESKNFKVTLGHRSVTFDMFNRNMQMSGPVSKRKDNFPMIIQHDLPLPKEAMGGPLFNLEGKCIGINIARVDRVTVFSLPAQVASENDYRFTKLSYASFLKRKPKTTLNPISDPRQEGSTLSRLADLHSKAVL